jgi:glutamyl-tRNA synthetase
MGYLPEALFNFLSGSGWSLDDHTEIYDRETAIKHFDLKDINPAPARFPAEKLEWMNGVYIRMLSIDELVERLIPYLSRDLGIPEEELARDERLRIIAPAIQERLKKLTDAAPLIDFLYQDEIDIGEPKLLVPRKTTPEQTVDILTNIIATLEQVESWDEETLEQALRGLAGEMGLKAGQVFSPIRQAVTGKKVAPPPLRHPGCSWQRDLSATAKSGTETIGAVHSTTIVTFDLHPVPKSCSISGIMALK